ncbi:PTS lactose/cellobiose transporter subunit IIA [Borrelia sp. P9F1]|uniref:PTS lactose/cellobiose transporter subunit IIA n=1 Tax=Borrelia sp. P9F1 TaxID=3058374 RepID=UPI002647205D|nr:PTS lactose/cellobiose transporter subunit IIA [Borrelia sp. P9F1]WKC57636.1 PTS lactose/cellobiose transporter subunit IIA [Borrelia sp. P9F1]
MLSDELNRYIGDKFVLILDKASSVRHRLYKLLKEVKRGNFDDVEYELSEIETLITNINALQAEFMSDGKFIQNVYLSLTVFNMQNCIIGLLSEKNLIEELIYLNKKIQGQ